MPNPFQRHDSEFTLRSVFNLEGSLTSLLADVFPTVYLLCNTGVPVRHAAVLSAPLGTKKKKVDGSHLSLLAKTFLYGSG